MDLASISDDEFYAHKRDVDEESSRRTRRNVLPEQIAAMIHDATDAGISDSTVRQTVETALKDTDE
ncbi:hypothetical protein DEO23_13985 [Brachybacterium endophyticum]|uniref:Uncharacterized protein n=1 Tax=Brachybacterium endophyticum TaxID=2182385 RepID=A0A2U2RH57_9MICO|nr:hypothetical protein [Brachybacterium endophyticum]PWH05186.1 hypothetical protein DEO23_13985 [Brachybacterium endophyticum]